MKHFTEFMNENLQYERDLGFRIFRLAQQLRLNDGTTLSIQASDSHYCRPRESTPIANYAWYDEFEIGFPSVEIEELLPYAEDSDQPTDTVYGYVPKPLIEEIIENRGGVKEAVVAEEEL